MQVVLGTAGKIRVRPNQLDIDLSKHRRYKLSSLEAKELSGSIVYILMDNKDVLYVGYSARGLTRPLSLKHPYTKKCIDDSDTSSMIIYPCRDEFSARHLERILIAKYKPKYNDTRNISSEEACV